MKCFERYFSTLHRHSLSAGCAGLPVRILRKRWMSFVLHTSDRTVPRQSARRGHLRGGRQRGTVLTPETARLTSNTWNCTSTKEVQSFRSHFQKDERQRHRQQQRQRQTSERNTFSRIIYIIIIIIGKCFNKCALKTTMYRRWALCVQLRATASSLVRNSKSVG